MLFNINVYKKQLYLSVTKPNKNTSRWRFFVCLIVCFCLFLRSKRISRWGQKKITEQPTRTRSKLFIYRISSADKHECAWPIRKGATALCLLGRSGVFCGPITEGSEARRMWWRFALDLYWKLLRCCKMTKLQFFFFEYCVQVPLSSRINKGKKRKALISSVRKKF